MIEYNRGDILKCPAEAIVNTVNCVGVMGHGIALQFKQAYPANFKAYSAACQRGEVQPGRLLVFETGQLTAPRYLINFPTKRRFAVATASSSRCFFTTTPVGRSCRSSSTC